MAGEDLNEEERSEEDKKKFLFLMRKAPYGSIYPQGGLEVILIMAAYDQTISVLFADDGVFCLKKGQETAGIHVKDFSSAFKVLESYGVEHLYVDKTSLEERGMKPEDLLTGVEVVSSDEMSGFLSGQDVILPF
ncbi:MAG: sulfurtransferase complex subunit TusC [Nitrospinae bacterium]|nr:sulfurtransferase complex subunit TusC [Nitrospinota bacterium]